MKHKWIAIIIALCMAVSNGTAVWASVPAGDAATIAAYMKDSRKGGTTEQERKSYRVCTDVSAINKRIMRSVAEFYDVPMDRHGPTAEQIARAAYADWEESERILADYLKHDPDNIWVRNELMYFAGAAYKVALMYFDMQQVPVALTILKRAYVPLKQYGTEKVFRSKSFQQVVGSYFRYIRMLMREGRTADAVQELAYIGEYWHGTAVSVMGFVSTCNNEAIECAKKGDYYKALLFIVMARRMEEYFPFTGDDAGEYKHMFIPIGDCFKRAANAGALELARLLHDEAYALFTATYERWPDVIEQQGYISGQMNTLVRLYEKNNMSAANAMLERRRGFEKAFGSRYLDYVRSKQARDRMPVGRILRSA